MTQREPAARNASVPQQSDEVRRSTGGLRADEAHTASPQSSRVGRLADLAERINGSPRAMRSAQSQFSRPAPGAAAPVVVQRQIRGGTPKVYRLLEKQEEWTSFIGGKSKKSKAFAEALEAFLQDLHGWDTGFDPEEVAEAIRTNEFTTSGLAQVKKALVRELVERIDEEVLSGGHSGERHYGKDEKFQRERLKKEGKQKATTLEDSAATKKFFTAVKKSVRGDLMTMLNPLIWEVANGISDQKISSKLVKDIVKPFINRSQTFSRYSITLEQISVSFNQKTEEAWITPRPKLESVEEFPKTEFTPDAMEKGFWPIVMYWGENSPQIRVESHSVYDELYAALEEGIVAPVTAF
jgi:hypothetical protein